MGTLANSEDPDEMQLNAAFQQGLHCLLIQNQYQGARWLSGRVLDSSSNCRRFQPLQCHCVVSLSKTQ